MSKINKRTEKIEYSLGEGEELVTIILMTRKKKTIRSKFIYGAGATTNHPMYRGARQANLNIGASLAKLLENLEARNFEETLEYIDEMKIDVAELLGN